MVLIEIIYLIPRYYQMKIEHILGRGYYIMRDIKGCYVKEYRRYRNL